MTHAGELGRQPDHEVVRRTQRLDIARSIPLGVILPLETSVLLMIAIKHFDAAPITKGFVAAAAGVGLLLSPAVTALARRRNVTAMAMASAVSVVGAIAFAVAATGPLALFVVGAVVGVATGNVLYPLLTFTYERNYPSTEIGRRVGRGLMMRVAISAPLAIAMGAWLRERPDEWWIVVMAGSAACVALVVLYRQFPSERLTDTAAITSTVITDTDDQRRRVLPHFELLGEDRQLRLTLGAWMLMGFGNLMLMPLRVEYLAQPQYGIEADAATITLLTVAIPSVARLLTTPIFGRLFDRISFFSSRIMINLLFAAYVAAFFTGSSALALVAGAVMLGIAAAGGDLMWVLWVTKFAPSHRVADYMGLHTFATGVRAMFAPLLAFMVLDRLSLGWVAAISAALMILSSLILVPEARADRRARSEATIGTELAAVADPAVT